MFLEDTFQKTNRCYKLREIVWRTLRLVQITVPCRRNSNYYPMFGNNYCMVHYQILAYPGIEAPNFSHRTIFILLCLVRNRCLCPNDAIRSLLFLSLSLSYRVTCVCYVPTLYSGEIFMHSRVLIFSPVVMKNYIDRCCLCILHL